tara:strand:- start:738 stop:875 length:138 start_codon:yes stop_codon:yes gene_type:complete
MKDGKKNLIEGKKTVDDAVLAFILVMVLQAIVLVNVLETKRLLMK